METGEDVGDNVGEDVVSMYVIGGKEVPRGWAEVGGKEVPRGWPLRTGSGVVLAGGECS